jgi:hypothetical protein
LTFIPYMKINIRLVLAVSTMVLAGCSSPVRTLEFKEGKLSMTEEGRRGSTPSTWDLKEVSSAAEVNTLRKSGWTPADGTVRNSRVHHEGGVDTFLMKRQVKPPAVAAPAPFRPMFITTRGTNTTPDGLWRVGVSAAGDSLDLSRSTAYSDGKGFTISGWSTTSPQGWTAHTGWFVFTESESRVWAYDGDRVLILNTETSSGNNFSGAIYSSRFPCAVPAEVLSRLSGPAQNAIQAHE